MQDSLNKILNFFYVEKVPTSAYNNRFIFSIAEIEFYRIIDMLEACKFIEAVGIRHSVQGYNLYQITVPGIECVTSGGFNEERFKLWG